MIGLDHPESETQCPLWPVGSTNRCNPGVKSLRRGFECQSLTVAVRWFVELTSQREVLPQQTIGVFHALGRKLQACEGNRVVGAFANLSLNKVAHLISALDWISAGTTEATSVR